MPYQYDAKNYDAGRSFKPDELLTPGDYICRIKNADYMTSRSSGLEMIRVEFAVSGHQARVFYYLPLRDDTYEHKQETDQRLGELFAACAIDPGKVDPMNLDNWISKTCGVHVKNTTYNGEKRNTFHYFLSRADARALAERSRSGEQKQPVDNGSAPKSYRDNAQRTTGPGGKPGFDRFGDPYPPAENVRLDENDNFVTADEGDEADIPF